MKKWIMILASLPMLWACDTNEISGPVYDPADIQQVDSFLDVRDQQKYGCVRIGDRIWMTRNLAYYLPNGSCDNCCTWGEEKLDIEDVALPGQDWYDCVVAVLDDPAYDWVAEGVDAMDVLMWADFVAMGYPPESLLSYYQTTYPSFYEVLTVRLDEATLAMVPQYALEHRQEAEEENGGYSSEYGYLYSYDAACKAVPDGWRLPTDEDWKALERTLGMSEREIEKMDVWRGNGQGDLLKYGSDIGFQTKLGGGNVFDLSNSPVYIRKGENAYFWSATKMQENDSTSIAIIRSVALFTDQILRTTTRLENGYREMMFSVRCVKDAE